MLLLTNRRSFILSWRQTEELKGSKLKGVMKGSSHHRKKTFKVMKRLSIEMHFQKMTDRDHSQKTALWLWGCWTLEQIHKSGTCDTIKNVSQNMRRTFHSRNDWWFWNFVGNPRQRFMQRTAVQSSISCWRRTEAFGFSSLLLFHMTVCGRSSPVVGHTVQRYRWNRSQSHQRMSRRLKRKRSPQKNRFTTSDWNSFSTDWFSSCSEQS